MRPPRAQGDSNIYHIVARGSGRQLIFEDDGDRLSFLSTLSRASEHYRIAIYGWCLMGNHIHLLLHAPIIEVSKAMQAVLSSYAQRYNERTGRSGHLFQERFCSEPIEDDAHLLSALRYVHLNPEKAGIATHDRYAWSSYGEYLGTADACIPDICSTGFILGLFDSMQDFIDFHRSQSREQRFLDIDAGRSATRPMPDEEAIRIAQSVLGKLQLPEIKTLDRHIRNSWIIKLLEHGLSVRQIERLTGISRGIVDYVRKTCQMT